MTYRVGPKGQVVLPKALREQLGIKPGDEVDVELRDEGLLVRRAGGLGAELRGILKGDGARPLTEELLESRRRDREREERKHERWTG